MTARLPRPTSARVRRRPWRDDRGASNLFLVPAVAGLLSAALLVITVLGSATADSRESRTAADAAALAAADAWRDALRDAYLWHTGSDDFAVFWAFPGTDLGSLASSALPDAAGRFARANGAELVSVDVDPGAAQVSVRVRNLRTVPESGERIEHTATAQLVMRRGVCRSGSALGYLAGGRCLLLAPPPPPLPTPEPEPSPDPTATATPSPTPSPVPPPVVRPPGLGAFQVDTRLTLP